MDTNQDHINAKMRTMSDELNVADCPVCNETSNNNLYCQMDGPAIYSCNKCSTKFVFPIPEAAAPDAYCDGIDPNVSSREGGYLDYVTQDTVSEDFLKTILEGYQNSKGLSILDVGCGNGSCLSIAAELGWICFGVEISDDARGVAKSRLGNAAYIVKSISDMIPHEFDLILLFDVIEHLHSPYALFYSLFSIGAITPKTRFVITTPDAGSQEARCDPSGWANRQASSRLVFYTAESLTILLKRLQFATLKIQGLHPLVGRDQVNDVGMFDGLLAYAEGSNFAEFMRERYVPGTWSKIAEFEHIPRYALARTLAVKKLVLDFGCGTGYGAAMLAEVATDVTGLDIDIKAHNWARECHHNPRLHFHLCNDLGATLDSKTFDLVTCFEMIEHVDHDMQRNTIASIARLMRDDGVLLISTPNPEVTKRYGENPYHLREMTQQEFSKLLKEYFTSITILNQRVCVDVSFEGMAGDEVFHTLSMNRDNRKDQVTPLAFVAICSKANNVNVPSFIAFDNTDYILDFIRQRNKSYDIRMEAYRSAAQVRELETIQYNESIRNRNQVNEFAHQISTLQTELVEYRNQAGEFTRLVSTLQNELSSARIETAHKAGELSAVITQHTKALTSVRFLAMHLFSLICGRLVKRFFGNCQ